MRPFRPSGSVARLEQYRRFDYAGRHDNALQQRLLLYYSAPTGGLKACAYSQNPPHGGFFYEWIFVLPGGNWRSSSEVASNAAGASLFMNGFLFHPVEIGAVRVKWLRTPRAL
jgi:hypothetical protein